MTDSFLQQPLGGVVEPQCQYFVLRKKRLCRMTVRPGRQYCGEHEPQPKTTNGQDDTRIPCPNDPKHTVYVSKLEKHLTICNARATEQPPYIVPNINAPTEGDICPRKPLSQLSWETVMQVIDKVNYLYDKHVKDNITTAPEYPIHSSVMEEFLESDRTESSLRHLRQVSNLLWLAEEEGLVGGNTCYVELGAGKGHVSYYACRAWCGAEGSALLVDRAALRHKRDNALQGRAARLRADLAHLALQRVPAVAQCRAVVGLAKHLCGVATDYALRCMTAPGVLHKTRGVVLATCCHHRCERAALFAAPLRQELGISDEEFNVMLGIVSWATCGDGRSRDSRRAADRPGEITEQNRQPSSQAHEPASSNGESDDEPGDGVVLPQEHGEPTEQPGAAPTHNQLPHTERVALPHTERVALPHTERVALPHTERVAPPHTERVAPPHTERVAPPHTERVAPPHTERVALPHTERVAPPHTERVAPPHTERVAPPHTERVALPHTERVAPPHTERVALPHTERVALPHTERVAPPHTERVAPPHTERVALPHTERARVGRRAKLVLDWARVLRLRECGFDARLCHFVRDAVSLENVCIVAKKRS